MKIILFGATGMVGSAVLRECLLDPDVERVLSIGRSPSGERHPKLSELVHKDFTDFSNIERELAGYDACFFCLGITAIGVGAFTPDFSSIQASSSDFLNRHRFPSLNAGMNPSDAYRYNVSPLMPRYSDACRISITSRTAVCTATAITGLRSSTSERAESRIKSDTLFFIPFCPPIQQKSQLLTTNQLIPKY